MGLITLGGGSGGGSTAIASANILDGYLTFSATAIATTLITIPAGRTWQGVWAASVTVSQAAAGTAQGQVNVVFATAGTGVVPTAGNYFAIAAVTGANGAGGTTGVSASNNGSLPFTVAAPVGNTVTVTVVPTILGSGAAGRVDVSAIGVLL